MEKQSYFHGLEKEIKRYDIILIGGGPSTIAFLCYLYQNNKINKFISNMNILIIEKNDNFGSGCLGNYGINTNTSSEGFARLICYNEEKKFNKLALSPSKAPMKKSKNYKNNYSKMFEAEGDKLNLDNKSKFNPITNFVNLFNSSSVQTLISIGNRPAPLTLVGYFLDNLGNYIIDNIYSNFGKNILLNRTEVKSIKLYNNEEFGITIKQEGKEECYIKSVAVILATGGVQSVSRFYKKIVEIKGENQVFLSDNILQKEGYMNIYNKIVYENKKRVVIIGGSHSGFSSAWILINSPSSYNKIGNDITLKKCTIDCTCFGNVTDRNWNIETNNPLDIEIIILYRDMIRVFYSTEEDALEDNYVYSKKEAVNKQGRVYPFIGLRGDAKELYKRIVKGEEKRVKLIKTIDDNMSIEYINKSDIVIWACGYSTNTIPIKDFRNNCIEFSFDNTGMIEVDKQLMLVNKNKISVKNLYGIGQGYSTKAPEMINGKKARADSIHLYNTNISDKLYRSLENLINKVNTENIRKKDKKIENVKKTLYTNTENIKFDYLSEKKLSRERMGSVGKINSKLVIKKMNV